MAIQVQCTHCARDFQVRDDLAGKQVKCPCGSTIAVPAKSALVNLLDEELDIKVNPVVCTTPQEWAKAAGASPEVAEALKKRMSDRRDGQRQLHVGTDRGHRRAHANHRPGGGILLPRVASDRRRPAERSAPVACRPGDR